MGPVKGQPLEVAVAVASAVAIAVAMGVSVSAGVGVGVRVGSMCETGPVITHPPGEKPFILAAQQRLDVEHERYVPCVLRVLDGHVRGYVCEKVCPCAQIFQICPAMFLLRFVAVL